MSTLVGMQLSGRYRLDAQIGAGGMSTVYRAFDQTLERQVAIKLMHREIASDSDQLERFRREARAVAQLSHPHIVGVIDAGEDEGRPYIVFEYVEGETLKERIRRMGRLPMDEAIAYAIEIARALGCAHARHIVHRDVKPQNVLIDAEGSAKVTDFGIARTLDQDGPDRRRPRARHHRLRLARAGARPRRQRPVRHLLARRRALRDADRRRPVPRREPGLRGDEARPRGHARPAGAPPRGVGHARLGARPHDRQGPRAPLPRHRHAGRRPRGGAGDRGRALGPVDRRGDRRAAHAAAVRAPPAAVPHAPPAAGRSRSSLLLAVGAALVVLLLKEGVDRAERGTGAGNIEAPAGEQVVSVASTSANDYDPLGDDDEHPERAPLVVDREPDTTLDHRELQQRPRGREQGRRRHLPRRQARRRGRADGDPEPRAGLAGRDLRRRAAAACRTSIDAGWKRLGGGVVQADHQRFKLADSGERYRYYLVWITELPPDAQRVEIGEIALLQRNADALELVARALGS